MVLSPRVPSFAGDGADGAKPAFANFIALQSFVLAGM